MQILNLSPDLTPEQRYAIQQAVANATIQNGGTNYEKYYTLDQYLCGFLLLALCAGAKVTPVMSTRYTL